MINQPISITPKQVWCAVTVVAALVVSTAVATWEIRKDVVESLKLQVESYEKSTNWKLPEAIAEIRNASETLALLIGERKELDALRAESERLREVKVQLEESLKQSTEKLLTAEENLSKILLKAESVELMEGQSAPLIKNTIYLGVTHVSSSSVHVLLAERSEYIDVGQSKKFSFGNKTCQVTLLRVVGESPRRAVFNHGCI